MFDPHTHPDATVPGPRLFGVMVTYRRVAALREHLIRLRGQTRPIDHLVVIDNDAGSRSDDVAAEVAAHADGFVSASYLRSEANLGPAGGIARGMEWAIEWAADDDWIVLLDDDDPPFADDVIEHLVHLAAGAPGTEPRPTATVGGVGVIGSAFDRGSGRMRRLADDELRGSIDVDYIGSNQFPMYRVGAVRATGVFDPALFWGYDDLDYGLRMRRAGFRLVISGELARRARGHFGHLTPDDSVEPSSGARSRPTAARWRGYYTTRNLIHILRKHGLDRVAWRRATVGAVVRPVLGAAKDPTGSATALALDVRGARDGWTERMGRRVAPQAKAS